jgi:hypothetical protein
MATVVRRDTRRIFCSPHDDADRKAKNQSQALLVEAEALLAQEVALSERCAYGERWLCGAVLDSTMKCSRDPTNSARVIPGQTGIVLLRSAFR